MKPGPKPQPYMQVVREGTVGRRAASDRGVVVPVVGLVEPDWPVYFPTVPVPARPKRPAIKADEEPEAYAVRLAEHAGRVAAWERQRIAAEGSRWCRERAAEEWARVVPVLTKSAGLAAIDTSVTLDYCVATARVEWCERRISVEGLIVTGQRGPVRNPLTTIANQYRTQLKAYIGELGLSPSSRGRLTVPQDGEDDDPFD